MPLRNFGLSISRRGARPNRRKIVSTSKAVTILTEGHKLGAFGRGPAQQKILIVVLANTKCSGVGWRRCRWGFTTRCPKSAFLNL